MISIPRGYGFRSGVGATVEDGTQDDWSGVNRFLSLNIRGCFCIILK
jgi:hypothetical protein